MEKQSTTHEAKQRQVPQFAPIQNRVRVSLTEAIDIMKSMRNPRTRSHDGRIIDLNPCFRNAESSIRSNILSNLWQTLSIDMQRDYR
jgi:hypothetical protein